MDDNDYTNLVEYLGFHAVINEYSTVNITHIESYEKGRADTTCIAVAGY